MKMKVKKKKAGVAILIADKTAFIAMTVNKR